MVQSRKSDYICPQMEYLPMFADIIMMSNIEDYDVTGDTIEW
jgi:hypothetical protein